MGNEYYAKIGGLCCVYGVMDGHGTVWERGVFDVDIETVSPGNPLPLFFSHAIHGKIPLGRVSELIGLDMGVYFLADVYDVYTAKHMIESIQDGTISGTSFSFSSVKSRYRKGVKHFTSAIMREVSPCVWPSIPGTTCDVLECLDKGIKGVDRDQVNRSLKDASEWSFLHRYIEEHIENKTIVTAEKMQADVAAWKASLSW